MRVLVAFSLLALGSSHSCADELLPLCDSIDSPADRAAAPQQCITIPTLQVSFSNTALNFEACGFSTSITKTETTLDSYTRTARSYGEHTSEATYKADATNFGLVDPLHPARHGDSTAAASLAALDPLDNHIKGMPRTYQTTNAPKLSYHNDPAKLYTVLMVDAGTSAEYSATPCKMRYLNWLVVNVPGVNVAGGDVIASYSGPTNQDLQPHLYTFAVYEQHGEMTTAQLNAATALYSSSPEDRYGSVQSYMICYTYTNRQGI